tara:strand:+ start:135 stop:641 length:507 start_codon:yes stop_codon:yes gene_type:complete
MIQDFKQDVENLGRKLVEDLRKELVAQGHVAKGLLHDTLEFKVSHSRNDIILHINGQGYAEFVERGRKKGKRPPLKAIYDWVVTKGISDPKKSQRSIAFAIATAIGRHGTPLRGSYEHTRNGRRKNFISITLRKNKEQINSTVKLFGEEAIDTITQALHNTPRTFKAV